MTKLFVSFVGLSVALLMLPGISAASDMFKNNPISGVVGAAIQPVSNSVVSPIIASTQSVAVPVVSSISDQLQKIAELENSVQSVVGTLDKIAQDNLKLLGVVQSLLWIQPACCVVSATAIVAAILFCKKARSRRVKGA